VNTSISPTSFLRPNPQLSCTSQNSLSSTAFLQLFGFLRESEIYLFKYISKLKSTGCMIIMHQKMLNTFSYFLEAMHFLSALLACDLSRMLFFYQRCIVQFLHNAVHSQWRLFHTFYNCQVLRAFLQVLLYSGHLFWR